MRAESPQKGLLEISSHCNCIVAIKLPLFDAKYLFLIYLKGHITHSIEG